MNLFARIPFGYKLRLITGLLMGSTALAALTEVLRLSRTQSISLWAIAVCGGSLALIALELTSHRTIATIRRLAERAHSITEGNLTGEPVHVDAEDDVGDLAHSMDRMQQSIQGVIAAIKETSGALHDNCEDLARAGTQAWNRTSQQSAQTHQAASAMQEMSISIAEVSGHAQTASDQAREAATVAREGGAIVEEMLAGMNTISESVSQTAETVERLGKESEQIIRIVNVIEEIAQKTNLLALNAAIEAARAGEQGRGFAVVAGEVRRLAESTRNATSEIAQMIESITANTQAAVQAMGSGTDRVNHGMEITARAGASLKRIMAATDQVESMIAQIATASTEQSIAAQEFSQNLEVINQLGEEGNAASPVTKGLVQSVGAGADRLQESIGHFRLGEPRSVPDPSPRRNASIAAAPQPTPTFGD
jgi:methyl-accepting chemotaxis protein